MTSLAAIQIAGSARLRPRIHSAALRQDKELAVAAGGEGAWEGACGRMS